MHTRTHTHTHTYIYIFRERGLTIRKNLDFMALDCWPLSNRESMGQCSSASKSAFNLEFSIQFRIQCSISNSVFIFNFSVQFRIQFSISNSVFNFEFSVQFRFQCSISNSVFNFKFSVQFRIQCSISNSAFNFKFNVQFRIERSISNSVFNFELSVQFRIQCSISTTCRPGPLFDLAMRILTIILTSIRDQWLLWTRSWNSQSHNLQKVPSRCLSVFVLRLSSSLRNVISRHTADIQFAANERRGRSVKMVVYILGVCFQCVLPYPGEVSDLISDKFWVICLPVEFLTSFYFLYFLFSIPK